MLSKCGKVFPSSPDQLVTYAGELMKLTCIPTCTQGSNLVQCLRQVRHNIRNILDPHRDP